MLGRSGFEEEKEPWQLYRLACGWSAGSVTATRPNIEALRRKAAIPPNGLRVPLRRRVRVRGFKADESVVAAERVMW
jgi:hypothetical protein